MGRDTNNLKDLYEIKWNAVGKLISSILILGLMFFLPAGTLKYWEAWLFLIILFIPVTIVFLYLIKNDPELLKRRLKIGEKDTSQKHLMNFSGTLLFIAFLIPGFDHRFNWTNVPAGVVILSDAFVLVGYYLFFLVLKENSYASRIIEVDENQQVVKTGPYAVVRHPMYLSILIMYIFSPLSLGSYWGVLALLIIMPAILCFRIIHEERILLKELPGYEAYTHEVKWRLIPHIW